MTQKFNDCTDALAKKFARFKDSMRAVVQDRPEYLLVCDQAFKVYGDTGVLIETSDRSFKIEFDKADKFLFFYAWFGPCQDMMIAYRNSEYKNYEYPSLSEVYKFPEVIQRFSELKFDDSFVLLTSMLRHMPEGTFGSDKPTHGDLDVNNNVVILDVVDGSIVREHFQSDTVVNSALNVLQDNCFVQPVLPSSYGVDCQIVTEVYAYPLLVETKVEVGYDTQPSESSVVNWLGTGWGIKDYHVTSELVDAKCGCYRKGVEATGKHYSGFMLVLSSMCEGKKVSDYLGMRQEIKNLMSKVKGTPIWFKEFERRLQVCIDKGGFTDSAWGDMLLIDAADLLMFDKVRRCMHDRTRSLRTKERSFLHIYPEDKFKAWVFSSDSYGVKVVLSHDAWKVAMQLFKKVPTIGFKRDWTAEFRDHAYSHLALGWDYGMPLWDMDQLLGYHYAGDPIEDATSKYKEIWVVNCIKPLPKDGIDSVVTTMNYCKLPVRCLAIYINVGFVTTRGNMLECVIQNRLSNIRIFPKEILEFEFKKGFSQVNVTLDYLEDSGHYRRVRPNVPFVIRIYLVSNSVNPSAFNAFEAKWYYGDDCRDVPLREVDVKVRWEADDMVSEIDMGEM